jgi:two-component system chemotaxis sensor kinase CheA
MGQDEEISDQEALQFVLRSGFSTAKAVTDVSGRGVGMDAVVTVIRNSLDGDLVIESEPGRGSSFTLDIPLARSANQGIVDALVCRLNSDVFLIPSQDVVEIYLPKDQDLVELPDGSHTVDVRGQIYGMVPLASVLGMDHTAEDVTRCQVVVVRVGDSRAAILVDEVLRQQQVVITKFTVPVEEIFQLPILGFGMMGESDALVVDTESLLQEVKGVADAGA